MARIHPSIRIRPDPAVVAGSGHNLTVVTGSGALAASLAAIIGSGDGGLTQWELVRGAGRYGFLVPYPATAVPSAIMTGQTGGEPTGADWDDHEWIGTYDPATVAVPSPTGASDEWYISSSGDDGTAGQGGQGTSAAPRRTAPPSGTYAAGTKFFFTGAGTFGSGNTDDRTWTFQGTSANPCFVAYIGANARADWSFDVFRIQGTHTIFEDIDWNMAASDQADGNNGIVSTDSIATRYISLRGCRVHSDGTDVGNESGLFISGTATNRCSMIYIGPSTKNDIGVDGLGAPDGPANNDYHGIRPLEYCDHIWIVDAIVSGCGGDGLQVANSGWNDGVAARRPHYIYILGGEWTNFGEQAVDLKNCYHVFFEEFHGYDNNTALSGGGTAGSLNFNNSEGNRTNYHYAYRSWFEGDTVGLFDQGDQSGQDSAAICCIFSGCSTGMIVSGANNGGDNKIKRAIDSLFYGNTTAAVAEAYSGVNGTLYLHGCILKDNAAEVSLDGSTEFRSMTNCLADRAAGSVAITSGDWDVYTDNILDQDPLLTDPANDDWHLSSDSSPCVGANTRHALYSTLASRYGVNIEFDYYGNPRPVTSGDWDIGPHQRT